ncbi:hypothetical protein ACQ4PT_015888 [Festuca glaucescens]
MTVGSGVLSGDGAGDSLSPAAVVGSLPISSSERAALGRFWALVDDDLRSGSEGEDEDEIEGGSARADYYLCRSPSPDVGRDLVETASGLARRAEKRLLRQRRQRMAAREFASPGCKVSPPTTFFSSEVSRSSRLPVLEPSTFPVVDGDDQGWTVVQRRHRPSIRPTDLSHDPISVRISNLELLGSVVDHNNNKARAPGRPTSLNAANREARRSKAQNARSNTQKIPFDANIAAGRAWHRRLGFWWARSNSSPRGGCDSAGGGEDAAYTMNNGGGGYGPGRGNGPGRGRGDRGDRGGNHGPGRGAGGHGFNAGGQGFGNGLGNGQSGFAAGRGGGFAGGRQGNFFTGESSRTSHEPNQAQGQHFSAGFSNDFGQFNRGSTSNSYRNGNNQQYRPRPYGNSNYNASSRYGYNGRANFNNNRHGGGGNYDSVIQNSANFAGINPELLKEAMQGVVAALAAAAQKGGTEEVTPMGLGTVVSGGAQVADPSVPQPQTTVSGVQQTHPMQVDSVAKADVPNPAKKAKKAPKPSVTMYGYAIEQLMFFEVPTGGAYKPKVDNLKLVKVTVEGDPMSIPEITECLKRIVPVENFQWEIYNFQNNVFRVKFPNKSEAQRMKAFRTYPVPDRASDLVFEDWSALEDPLYMLPEVWLRVRGIPTDVRTDFLALWAVGTLFGKTKEVDMVHTRKNKELRMRIGCLDHTLIPETTDVFIQRGFFKLSFEVEPVVVTQLDGVAGINNGDNDDERDNDGSNDDLLDGAKDMDIEKTMNNQQPSNASSKQSNVKKVSNAKGVVIEQIQHQVETPIEFGSLNSVLMSKDDPIGIHTG